MRSFHFPGRSPVLGRHAMVATSHPLATMAALDILKRGGNAVDAALAAVSVQCVVEPAMTGIGGDCFALLWKPAGKGGKSGRSGKASAKGELIALNGSGRAPKAATAEWYAEQGIKSIALGSPHCVTVPGAIDAWTRLSKDHGTMKLGDVLAAAIDHAEHGFPVAARVGADWSKTAERLRIHPGARQHLLPGGEAPKIGDVVRFPALARTLRLIAEGGRDAFYTGEVAKDIVAELNELGGLHTLDDLKVQASTYVTPISTKYGPYDIFELPPNLHGIVALILLNMLKVMGKPGNDPTGTDRYHMLMEAARLAYAARDAWVADPDTSKVPVEHMLSASFAEALVRRIDPRKRTPELGPLPKPPGSDTVYLCVADANGMVVSFINSVFTFFGSGIVTRKTGIVLHNRGMGFVLDPRHPNCIGPRKRPMHTLVPAMAMQDGEPAMAFGVMGAAFQPMGHTYVVTNIVDYGMDAQEAIDCPRVFFEGDGLLAEESVPAASVKGLKGLGHKVAIRPEPWGGGQIIQIDRKRGVLIGASDPRKDGCAMGW